MKIYNYTADNRVNNVQPKVQKPAFKGMAPLDFAGYVMEGIETAGFLASFLAQDLIGMTLPRTGAGFLRDHEVTGKLNTQEGFEVLGREGLTGPTMMAVAPLMLFLTSYWGRSSSINSQFIKRFGNSFKEFITSAKFDKSLLKNSERLKEEFYKKNIRDILRNTLGKGNYKEESVEHILKEIYAYQNVPKWAKKNKYQKNVLNNIVEYIDGLRFKTSDDLSLLNSVKLGSEKLNDVKDFSTKDTFDALMKYTDDVITNNKLLEKLDEGMAENLKNSAFAKRMITNVGTMAATLGVLSVLPKIYAKNSVPPSAQVALSIKESQNNEEKKDNKINEKVTSDVTEEPVLNTEANTQEVSFKGKAGNSATLLSKLGKFLSKFSTGKFASELEYNGHNFTNTLMAGLSLGGLLAPRGIRAFNRAPVDEETGKKDLNELKEILLRDITSSLSVVFLVPILTRLAITLYEETSGFVLINKDRTKSAWRTALDLINPYSNAHVLKNSEIRALYDGIDSKEKMINFCKYIDKNGGDLEKIIKKSSYLEESGLKLPNLANLDKKARNKAITEYFEKLGNTKKPFAKLRKLFKNNAKEVDLSIEKLMKGIGKQRNNKILSFARGLNSIPGFIVTFLISPYILGWAIPRLTYSQTRKRQEKAIKEKENKVLNA